MPQEPLKQACAPPRFGNELEVARIMATAQVKAAEIQAQATTRLAAAQVEAAKATTRLAAATLVGLLAIGGAIYFATNKVSTLIDLESTHMPTVLKAVIAALVAWSLAFCFGRWHGPRMQEGSSTKPGLSEGV